jgi:lysophospholipid acyltransferase (LPLAT)-like uncharacterized protein
MQYDLYFTFLKKLTFIEKPATLLMKKLGECMKERNVKHKSIIKLKLLPPVIYFLLKFYYLLLRTDISGIEHSKSSAECSRQKVFAIWHGRQFFCYKIFGRQNTVVMSSTSSDGRLQGAVLKKFDFKVIWGSSNKSPAKALLGVVRQMQNGSNLLIAVDGPKGPVYKVKPGALFIAKKFNVPVVPVAFASDRYWQLNAWDNYILPKPFSRSKIIYGEPVYLPADSGNEELDHYCVEIELKLNQLVERAEKALDKHKE